MLWWRLECRVHSAQWAVHSAGRLASVCLCVCNCKAQAGPTCAPQTLCRSSSQRPTLLPASKRRGQKKDIKRQTSRKKANIGLLGNGQLVAHFHRFGRRDHQSAKCKFPARWQINLAGPSLWRPSACFPSSSRRCCGRAKVPSRRLQPPKGRHSWNSCCSCCSCCSTNAARDAPPEPLTRIGQWWKMAQDHSDLLLLLLPLCFARPTHWPRLIRPAKLVSFRPLVCNTWRHFIAHRRARWPMLPMEPMVPMHWRLCSQLRTVRQNSAVKWASMQPE